LDGIRLYLRGPGKIDSPVTETAVLDLVEKWAKQTPEPAIGMGVTLHWGTDYYPYTIRPSSFNKIWSFTQKRMGARGHSGCEG
jgi:hypothetical protein